MNEGKIVLKREKKNFEAGYCILGGNLHELEKSISMLHPEEKAYYDNLKFEKRKSSFLLGRIAAKKAILNLFKEENIQSVFIDFGIFQFPVVKNSSSGNIQVSITHTDDIGMAVAFPEEHPIGIDIEKIDPDKIDAIKSQITQKEIDLVTKSGLSEDTGYMIFWTIKEGLSKIFRTGLMMDFKILEISSFAKTDKAFEASFSYCAQYKSISYLAGEYICSIILPKNTTLDAGKLLPDFEGAVKNLKSSN